MQASTGRSAEAATPLQRGSHCTPLHAIRGWPVDNEGAAPADFARPDLAAASTTGNSQQLGGKGRQPSAGNESGGVAKCLCQSNLVPTITQGYTISARTAGMRNGGADYASSRPPRTAWTTSSCFDLTFSLF